MTWAAVLKRLKFPISCYGSEGISSLSLETTHEEFFKKYTHERVLFCTIFSSLRNNSLSPPCTLLFFSEVIMTCCKSIISLKRQYSTSYLFKECFFASKTCTHRGHYSIYPCSSKHNILKINCVFTCPFLSISLLVSLTFSNETTCFLNCSPV